MEGVERKRPRFRKLRIAFSAACGIICLLLIALWVRSYTIVDNLTVRVSSRSMVRLGSALAQTTIEHTSFSWIYPGAWHHEAHSSDLLDHARSEKAVATPPNFWFGIYPQTTILIMKHWALVLLAGVVGVAPWLPLRFSLRTLLIAMTLVAAILGIIVISI
jgi:hypothetical protein